MIAVLAVGLSAMPFAPVIIDALATLGVAARLPLANL